MISHQGKRCLPSPKSAILTIGLSVSTSESRMFADLTSGLISENSAFKKVLYLCKQVPPA